MNGEELDREAIEAHADIVFQRTVSNVVRLLVAIAIPILILVGLYFLWVHQQNERINHLFDPVEQTDR